MRDLHGLKPNGEFVPGGGGLNPAAYNQGCAAGYSYNEVSFLLEVYGQLEEPDGLSGKASGACCML